MTAAWTNEPDARLIAGGKTLEYSCWGPPPDKAMTLVLLHEGLGSVALWRDLPKRLVAATGLGVLAYSRAGYGASDTTDLPRPLDYQTREATEVLGDVLDGLGVQQTILIDLCGVGIGHAGAGVDPDRAPFLYRTDRIGHNCGRRKILSDRGPQDAIGTVSREP